VSVLSGFGENKVSNIRLGRIYIYTKLIRFVLFKPTEIRPILHNTGDDFERKCFSRTGGRRIRLKNRFSLLKYSI